MKRATVSIVSIAVIVILALWGQGFTAEDPVKAAGLLKFQGVLKAPDFVVEDLNGDKWRLSDYQGKVVLLSFWTTW